MEEHQSNPTIAVNKREAARELRICIRTLDNLLATKQLAYRKIGRRVVISRSSLVAFLRKAN